MKTYFNFYVLLDFCQNSNSILSHGKGCFCIKNTLCKLKILTKNFGVCVDIKKQSINDMR